MHNTVIELWVIDAMQGDVATTEKLYQHFSLPMRRYALQRVNDPMIAEDVVQNVWLQVSRRVRKLNNPALFKSWLYRALNWEIADWRKARPVADVLDDGQQSDAIVSQDIDLNSLLPLFVALDPAERDVVELFYLNGLSLAETALALDTPAGTVKSRLYRARQKLKTRLNQETNDDFR